MNCQEAFSPEGLFLFCPNDLIRDALHGSGERHRAYALRHGHEPHHDVRGVSDVGVDRRL